MPSAKSNLQRVAQSALSVASDYSSSALSPFRKHALNMINAGFVAAWRFNLNQRAETVNQLLLVAASLLRNIRNIQVWNWR
jgi:hypothetical protein